ncbi:MAG TPA: ABC transporter permease, partial [Candidatus Acidoferrales bacterium]|nr:ABC transporter permease [Candidatus Acidoferrales bacterium]
METLLQDLKYGARMLARTPAFTAIAILTLALGIGANTAIFSVIDSVLLKPLPFPAPEQLVMLRETESAPGNFPLDGADYLDWQSQNKSFDSMSLYSYSSSMSFGESGGAAPEPASATSTQSNFFETLGVQPLIGRAFAKGEDTDGKNHVVILSYAFWQRHLGGEQSAVGRQVELNGAPYTVIGVMPQWFNFPPSNDIWIPIDMNQELMHNRGSHWANAIGRVKKGMTVEQARADLLTISERINKQFRGADDQAIHSLVYPLKERLVGDSRSELLVLLGAVALVLLVACANIANLLLARSTGRQREMAVRSALGAGRWRLARQMLTESLLLAFGGAALGLVGARWGVSLLNSAKSLPFPQVNAPRVDDMVLLFTIAVSVLVGVLFGLAPALQTSSLNLSEELKSSAKAVVSGTAGGRLVRNALIVGEIAVSLALLVGAGLLLRSFVELRDAKMGIQPANVLTMRVNLPEAKYKTPPQVREFFDQLLAKISRTPGVRASAITSALPLEGGSNGYVTVPGNTNPALKEQLVEVHFITPDYFRVFGIPLIEGRNINEQDMQATADTLAKATEIAKAAKPGTTPKFPPEFGFNVVINEAMAKTFWPNQDPVGKEFFDESDTIPTRVIGVVGDVKQWGIREKAIPERYFPLTLAMDNPEYIGGIVVKTAVAPSSVTSAIRGDVAELDRSLALFHVQTMDEVIAQNMQDTTLQTFLLSVFAGLALILATIGLYGVMSYLVLQRTQEFGIRVALGAQSGDVLRLVMRQGIKLTVLGVAIGVCGALGLARLVKALLYGVSANDPLTFVAVAALLAAVALAACFIPARRA